ncbi:very short patch repair endonuclease [Rhizobium rhizogenes]|uniref:very short patch repair endonuclease n=1 Tax=Rhizobium rhizogenes TaxID=359 RepID=UPI00157345EF|nr:very short patch repair endonuclease [Rhizobium rhizogenes]NTF83610.1 very short patch repair endonuclease [Rhizobium rhizogenes]
MADVMNRAQRSYCMSQIRSRDTAPEMALRRALHWRGLRFRVRMKLFGKPDVVFTAARLVVFVDGCFWHGCPHHGKRPKSNQDYWTVKLARNHARDLEVTAALEAEGWTVLRFWDHEISDDLDAVVATVVDRWSAGTRSRTQDATLLAW